MTLQNAHCTFKSKKLIQVQLSFDDETNEINSVRITGDFFLYPEDRLELLETNLVGVKLDRNILKKKIEESLSNSQTFGFDSESLVDAILRCLM